MASKHTTPSSAEVEKGVELYLYSCISLWHGLEQTCLFSLKNAVVLSFVYYFPLYRQMCCVALWIKLCALVWNASCQIWSLDKWTMVTGTNLYIIQFPDYYFLLIIMVTLKVSLFICSFFQSLVGQFNNMTFIPNLRDQCSDLYGENFSFHSSFCVKTRSKSCSGLVKMMGVSFSW